MKLFAKHLETIIGGSTATLNLNGNKLLVELYDEIYLVILLTPEEELIVVFISLIQQMCPQLRPFIHNFLFFCCKDKQNSQFYQIKFSKVACKILKTV